MNAANIPTHDDARFYEIRIRGHLDERWRNRLEAVTIKPEDSGNTLLTGLIVDQAALYALLKKVRDMGLPLISVNRIEPDDSSIQETGLPPSMGDRKKLNAKKEIQS
ncbi:MAG: hypothetical protein ACOYYS_14445 [Chloroflexota bacterium]